MKPKVIVTRNFSGKWIERLKEFADVTLWQKDAPADREWLISNVKGKDGAIVMLTDSVDRELIEAGKGLKAISTMSVGYDHIDAEYARKNGIVVSNTPDVLTDSTADMGMALLLSAARRIVEGDRLVRNKGWKEKWKPDFMLGLEVSGKTLGIYGLGRIGKAVAERARAFSMNVIYYSRTDKRVGFAEYVDFKKLLSESDFLVVTVSLNEETRNSIDKAALDAMKNDAILVNISRGPVVDEIALYEALKGGNIAGAALDVYTEEPVNLDSPLVNLENIVLSPHLGSATIETRDKMAELAVTNLIEALKGNRPKYTV
ncbi:2-ketogluconate reductase [uncultured archaeon]|nr:2-ketogluconate reductase [uncultured archaeon]